MAGTCRPGQYRYVFREGRRTVLVGALLRELGAELDALAAAPCPEAARRLAESALLRAGELESLAADHGSPRADAVAALTDRLADTAAGATPPGPIVLPELAGALPAEVRLSPPEGFAYYAVDPLGFARLADDLALPSGAAAVLGIRTIGATLSAVVAATLRLRGVRTARLTVRPTGHPYRRELVASPALVRWIDAQRACGAAFVVVDEGPGMSGSSFLAVGDALVREGVDARRVTFLGTRAVDPHELLAEDAPRRFAAFAGLRTAAPAAPQEPGIVGISSGLWRTRFYADEARWPATWPAMERAKFLSADGRRLFKFDGLGRWGAAVRERARVIAEAGFGPPVADAGAGFTSMPFLAGRPLARADRSRASIERLADYCAFRVAAFPAPDADPAELLEMVRVDARAELDRGFDGALPVERPVIADARLHPHEWLATADGPALKVDAATHGDDHGFPGPTDIAWDLAGAVVEWELEGAARRSFLERYARASGDHPGSRLPAYLTAYLVAQLARASMAMGTLAGTPEAARLLRDHGRYLRRLRRLA